MPLANECRDCIVKHIKYHWDLYAKRTQEKDAHEENIERNSHVDDEEPT